MVMEYMNLYDLFVNNVFGSILGAAVGIGVVLFVIAMLMKISPFTSGFLVLFFLASFGLATSLGPLVFFVMLAFSLVYVGYGFIRMWGLGQ